MYLAGYAIHTVAAKATVSSTPNERYLGLAEMIVPPFCAFFPCIALQFYPSVPGVIHVERSSVVTHNFVCSFAVLLMSVYY